MLIAWKSSKSQKLKLSIFHIKSKEWLNVNTNQTPDFRLGCGSAILRIKEAEVQN